MCSTVFTIHFSHNGEFLRQVQSKIPTILYIHVTIAAYYMVKIKQTSTSTVMPYFNFKLFSIHSKDLHFATLVLPWGLSNFSLSVPRVHTLIMNWNSMTFQDHLYSFPSLIYIMRALEFAQICQLAMFSIGKSCMQK